MIIHRYSKCMINYSPYVAEVYDEESKSFAQPHLHPHKSTFTEVECLLLTKEQIFDEFHLGIDAPYTDVNGKEGNKHYHIGLKDYHISSEDKAFMTALFKLIVKFKNDELPADYNFIEEQPEVFV